MCFEKNITNNDRIIRAVIAVALTVIGLYVAGPAKWVLWAVAVILVFTAITGYCCLYTLLGKKGKKRKR